MFHNDIRGRFNRGEPAVVCAMARCAALAVKAREALLAGDAEGFGQCIDENFEQRRSIYHVPARQVQMVELARECGARAHFAGSGGAIVGTYVDDAMLHGLETNLGRIGCRVLELTVLAEL